MFFVPQNSSGSWNILCYTMRSHAWFFYYVAMIDVSALHGRMTSVTDKIGRLVECHDRHTGYLNTLIDQYEALVLY